MLEPTLEKLNSGALTEGGQRFAEAAVEKFRNHFMTKTSADMASLAGVAARSNINTLTNELSNAALRDPSSLKTSLGLIEHSVGSMVESSPNLKGADAAKLKIQLTDEAQAQIVKSAAIGAINANPEAGLKKFSGPEYSKYISGGELKQLEQQAKAVERARRVDENYALQNQKLFKQEQSDRIESDVFAKIHSEDPKVRATVKASDIASNFDLTREARQRLVGIIERETKPETAAKVSNATAIDLVSRIRAPEGDPRRITDLGEVYAAYERGNLNKADLKFVREEFDSLRTPDGAALGKQQDEFIKAVKPMIDKSNPLLGKIDQSGAMQTYAFTLALQRKIAEYRRAGKDPRDLMDPSKPDYMGSPSAIAAYQKPLQQSLSDVAASLRGGGGGAKESVMPAIPPVEQRTPGLYETPKGPMRWTGTGWVKP